MHETEEKIIRKALQYFAQNDYQKASLNSIAKEIGVTKGAIYHYFDSKDDLLKRSIVYFFDLLIRMLDEMVPQEGDVSIEELIRSFFATESMVEMISRYAGIDFFRDSASYLYLLFTGFKKYPELMGKITGIYSAAKSGMVEALEGYRAMGLIREDLDCEAFASQLLVMSEGFMLFVSIDQQDVLNIRSSSEAIVQNLLKTIK